MYHWFAMDIVAALADLLEDEEQPRIKVECFLLGYRSVLSISDDIVAELLRFLRFSQLYGFSRLLYALENSVLEDAPPWYEPLKLKLIRVCEERRKGFAKPW